MPMITEATPVRFSAPLPDSVEVVVIGAGIIGTATAWCLAQRGVRVLLCEKGRVAGEQSSRNWGWVRQQGRDRAELPIMMESNRIWRGLAAETGERDLELTQAGVVYLAETEEKLAALEAWFEVAREHQLDTRMLSADEATELASDFSGRWIGGIVTPSDARAEPFVAVPALARAASAEGATVIEDCAVRTVESSAGRVSAVVTEHGRVPCSAVVLAGGAWSTHLAANIGLDLPQLAVRSTASRTHPAPERTLANTSADGMAIRRRADGGYTVSTGDVAEHYVSRQSFRYFTRFLRLLRAAAKDVRIKPWPPSGYPGAWGSPTHWTGDDVSPFERTRVLNPPPSPLALRRLHARLPERAPWLAEAGIAESWAGMIDVTPDAVPYICEAPSPAGLFLGTGMSGHGFGIGPAVGRILADLVQGRPPGHDLHRFRFDRFHDGTPITPGPY